MHTRVRLSPTRSRRRVAESIALEGNVLGLHRVRVRACVHGVCVGGSRLLHTSQILRQRAQRPLLVGRSGRGAHFPLPSNAQQHDVRSQPDGAGSCK